MKDKANSKEINKNFKRINIKSKTSNFTIIFFHGTNHSSMKYNYTYETNGTSRKNYFLNKLSELGNLFLYNRPEEILRFNYENGISNCGVDYPNYTIDTHITNLHHFLHLEKIKPPYVLVSHSIGALYAVKFAQKYSKETKHVFLIDPTQYTKKIAKEFYSPPISNSDLEKHTQIIKNPKSPKNKVEKSLSVLDSNTYSIPYFTPKLECPLTTFFNVDTKTTIHQKLTLPYIEELKKYNSKYNNYFYYDRDHYLNETNPQGLVTTIKKELTV
jgi:pimeloyl-ACP methyl ester carboxylesterase